ncbi:MAG: AMP-binding protein [Acidobacteria bacterium]|nr:AMP-binding protein [Acidobacteriota bacterium]
MSELPKLPVEMHPIAHMLSQAGNAAPHAPALLAAGREPLDYFSLWNQTQSHVRHLRALAVGPQDRIAIVLPNGPEMASAFLSVACACAAAPLNPGYTLDDFRFYLEDLQAKALLAGPDTSPAALDAARLSGTQIIMLHPGARAGEFTITNPATMAGEADFEWPAPNDIALLLHTSGTTSRPKLVPLSAANLASSARNIAQTLQLTPEDRCLNIMPLFHIHGLAAALLASLQVQASVVCTDGIYAKYFFNWLKDTSPTWYTAVPTMHQGILSRARELGDTARNAKLRFIRSSSAALPPIVLEGLEEVFGSPVLEAYGMTEASHQMTSNPLPPRPHKPGFVGLAAGPEVAIMNAEGDLLPAGEVGEVVIRGPNVISGYLCNEDANRTAFTNGWFRTGDQGRFDDEGYLCLTGRLKELINRGGEKISPREIDEALLAHPDVKQALAFAIPHAQLGEEVGAAVELQAGSNITSAALRTFAAGRLAHFKVPRILQIVDTIPKGPTGKLQRIGLASKLGLSPIDDKKLGNFESPITSLEAQLAAIWKQFLPNARCGRHDRFEALGGDSLLAAQMLTQLSASLNKDIPYHAFVAEATIAALASALEAQPAAGSTLFQTLKPSSGDRTVYCFPGHDGVLLGLTRMAQHIDKDVSIEALLLNQLNPQESLQKHAQTCTDEILRRNPHGPFLLAGVCFGGCLAFEVAHCLAAKGGNVQFLCLIDTLNPAWKSENLGLQYFGAEARQLGFKLRHHVARIFGLGPLGAASYLAGRIEAFFKSQLETSPYRNAMHDYRPQPWPSNTLVLRFPGRRLDAPALGWTHLVKGYLELVNLPFEPEGSLAKDSAARVAAVLAAHL